jgi:ABC-type branched-subunit amino acid transport system ATPase component
MVAVAPRSTRIHSGSWPSALAQRVVALLSTALAASKELLSTDEAVAGLPCESSESAAIEADGAKMG